ncbi:hypothetical protein EYF80_009632 [Liparis tanakae]|uniref:Uncharacterized protein n=1 Tax=Liparis tanakae TaxID=230148 RepID=A0A4Z2IQL2_9TELE|nr:hypothetical protein EYF80_009632 [Liparis tanakae]
MATELLSVRCSLPSGDIASSDFWPGSACGGVVSTTGAWYRECQEKAEDLLQLCCLQEAFKNNAIISNVVHTTLNTAYCRPGHFDI